MKTVQVFKLKYNNNNELVALVCEKTRPLEEKCSMLL